jgi:hypothetical protein
MVRDGAGASSAPTQKSETSRQANRENEWRFTFTSGGNSVKP